jgi:predicted nucleic acid-binding protein
MNVYFDVCCLNRLFDDLRQLRVATEAAAMQELLAHIDAGDLVDYSSEMARIEIGLMPDADRRGKVSAFLPGNDRIIPLNAVLLDRAEELQRLGFALADAVHLAAASSLSVDVFVTVDDRLLRRARRNAGQFGFRALNPAELLEEL